MKILRKAFSKTTKKERDKDITDLVIGAAGGLTLATTKKSHLTGKVTRYHNTSKKNVEDILENGIKSEFAKDPSNITNRVLGTDELEKRRDFIYTSKKKSTANSVGAQRSYLDGELLGRDPNLFDQFDPIINLKKGRESLHPKHSKTLKLSFKYDDIKNNEKIKNPELRNADGYFDFIKKSGIPCDPIMYRGLDKGTHIFKGDISPEHIVGSKHYKKYTIEDFKKYVKNNPKRFSKEVAKTAIGSTALAYAGVKAYKHHKNKDKE